MSDNKNTFSKKSSNIVQKNYYKACTYSFDKRRQL